MQRKTLTRKAEATKTKSTAGRLMDESHFSLRDLYEVSSFELDLFTELAREHPTCYGARLTGAGFGGCAIALVKREFLPDSAFCRNDDIIAGMVLTYDDHVASINPLVLCSGLHYRYCLLSLFYLEPVVRATAVKT